MKSLLFLTPCRKGSNPLWGAALTCRRNKNRRLTPVPPAPVPLPAALPAADHPAVPAARTAPAAAVAPQGEWRVQVASFRGVGDARKLEARLVEKGYAAFTREAELGTKGKWYRVMVGPFASETAVARAADRLKKEEKLSALIRRD